MIEQESQAQHFDVHILQHKTHYIHERLNMAVCFTSPFLTKKYAFRLFNHFKYIYLLEIQAASLVALIEDILDDFYNPNFEFPTYQGITLTPWVHNDLYYGLEDIEEFRKFSLTYLSSSLYYPPKTIVQEISQL